MFTLKRLYAEGSRGLTSFVLAVALILFASVTFAPAARGAVSPSTIANLTQEQIEAAVEEYFASIGSMDVSRFTNNFATDGVLEDPVGTPPVQGTSTIAAYFGAIIAPFSEIKPRIQEVIVCGHEAAVNWKLQLTTTTGKKITIDGMGVFNFNQDGKLQSVREFWDLAAFLSQLQG
jgi:steroid delta-isomerase